MKKTNLFRTAGGCAVLFCLLAACKKEAITEYDCTGYAPTYTIDVKPILNRSCAVSGCHNSGSKKSGLDYSGYAAARAGASESDEFLGSIQHKNGYQAMPRQRPMLSEAEIRTLSCWIRNGMPE